MIAALHCTAIVTIPLFRSRSVLIRLQSVGIFATWIRICFCNVLLDLSVLPKCGSRSTSLPPSCGLHRIKGRRGEAVLRNRNYLISSLAFGSTFPVFPPFVGFTSALSIYKCNTRTVRFLALAFYFSILISVSGPDPHGSA